MNKFNFIPDRAILKSDEDELNRSQFALQLKDSLSNWENEESLVISLKGTWGEGKSSVINLIKEQFDIKANDSDPTIIEFNPWAYANSSSLSFHFFNDIGSELKLKKAEPKDSDLAKKLKLYSQLINLNNESKLIKDILPQVVILFGILGISVSKIFNWINLSKVWIENALFLFGLILLVVQFFSGVLKKFATFIEIRNVSKATSPQSLKREIIKHLSERNKKLLIIIDDIDRLNQIEICEVFKLIRVNADFPNTIYFLAFDSNIVEQNLEEQKGISGKDYLKKIVQVDFNLPYTKNDKIQQYLFKELDKLIEKLPEKTQKYFSKENDHWPNTYHAGYKHFFKNIRDVKRYVNSLLFNINLLNRKGVLEVNPVDFIALESIRVFTPEFYDFIKFRKDLFTDSTDTNSYYKTSIEERRNEIFAGFEIIEKPLRENVQKLINQLFPQLDPILKEFGGSHYAAEFYAHWRTELRICSKQHFDAYFTLNPEENESELTQYDIERVFEVLNKREIIEQKIQQLISDKKLRPFLRLINDYTSNREIFNEKKSLNLIHALNNVSDKIAEDRESMFDLGIDMELVRVIYQLLAKEDQGSNYETLKKLIKISDGIFGLLHLISIQTSALEKNPDDPNQLFTKDNLLKLQKEIIDKIKNQTPESLLSNKNFPYILNRWNDWGDKQDIEEFISSIKNKPNLFMKFLNHFVSESRSTSMGSYGGERIHRQVAFNNLKRFVDLQEVSDFIESIQKDKGSDLYKKHTEFVKMFKSDLPRYKENPEKYADFNFD